MSSGRARTRLSLLPAVFLALVVCTQRLAASDGPPTEKSSVDLFREVAPAVVRVKVATESNELDSAGKPRVEVFVYSGFFISKEGRLLTNAGAGQKNAMERATRIWIEKDGLQYLAELVGADSRTNLAMLQVNKLPTNFGVISVTPGAELPSIGSRVLAVTCPLSLDPSPAAGLVTGLESNYENNVFPFTYVRVNIPGGPAEGGSPVLDYTGQLVGITVASLTEIPSSYLVPTRALERIVNEFSTSNKIAYTSLPLEFDEYPDAQNVARQVVITKVYADSAAARAGLRIGDIVRKLGSTTIRRLNDVRDTLFFAKIGDYIPVEVEREGRAVSFALQVEARQEAPATIPAVTPQVSTPQPPPAAAPQPGANASPPVRRGEFGERP